MHILLPIILLWRRAKQRCIASVLHANEMEAVVSNITLSVDQQAVCVHFCLCSFLGCSVAMFECMATFCVSCNIFIQKCVCIYALCKWCISPCLMYTDICLCCFYDCTLLEYLLKPLFQFGG